MKWRPFSQPGPSSPWFCERCDEICDARCRAECLIERARTRAIERRPLWIG